MNENARARQACKRSVSELSVFPLQACDRDMVLAVLMRWNVEEALFAMVSLGYSPRSANDVERICIREATAEVLPAYRSDRVKRSFGCI